MATSETTNRVKQNCNYSTEYGKIVLYRHSQKCILITLCRFSNLSERL